MSYTVARNKASTTIIVWDSVRQDRSEYGEFEDRREVEAHVGGDRGENHMLATYNLYNI